MKKETYYIYYHPCLDIIVDFHWLATIHLTPFQQEFILLGEL